MPIALVFWRWYYGEAIKDVLTGWKNYIIFSLNYFSIPLLLKTILAPWKRDITRKPRGFDIKKVFEYIAFNLISRGIGFLVRFFTIIVGIVFFLLVLIFGLLFFIVWLILPFAIVGLFIFAIILLL
jgi:hypothetical protein